MRRFAAIIHLDRVISQNLQWQTHLTFITFSETKTKQNYLICKNKSGGKISGCGKQESIYLKTFKVAPKPRGIW